MAGFTRLLRLLSFGISVLVGRVALHLEVVLVVLTSLLVHVRVQADLKRDIFRDRGK